MRLQRHGRRSLQCVALLLAALAACSCAAAQPGGSAATASATDWVLSGGGIHTSSDGGSAAAAGSDGSAANSGSERGLQSNPLRDGSLATVSGTLARRFGPVLAAGLDTLGDAVEHAAAATKHVIKTAAGSGPPQYSGSDADAGSGVSGAEQRRLQQRQQQRQRHSAGATDGNGTNVGRATQVRLSAFHEAWKMSRESACAMPRA